MASGLANLLSASKISLSVSPAILDEVAALGAVDVRELRSEDWAALPSWALLREMEKRRILTVLGITE